MYEKVFVESEDVGRTLDLSLLGSYDELNAKLAEMFEIEDGSDALARALYRDSTGTAKHIGDEPFRFVTKLLPNRSLHISPFLLNNFLNFCLAKLTVQFFFPAAISQKLRGGWRFLRIRDVTVLESLQIYIIYI